MNKLISGMALFLALVLTQVTLLFAEGKGEEIPRLQNPFSESYVRENLKQTKPRMICNLQILDNLKPKIKSDPVIKNLNEAIRIDAFSILVTPVISRIKTSNAMLDVSRESLRRVNMLGLVYLDVAEICMAVSLALDWTCRK